MNNTFEKIINHLEFLGYDVEAVETAKEGEKKYFLAKHPSKSNYLFYEIGPNLLIFRARYTTTKEYSSAMDKFINKGNYTMNITKVTYEIEENNTPTLIFESTYLGQYQKDLFGQFFDINQDDIKGFLSLAAAENIFD